VEHGRSQAEPDEVARPDEERAPAAPQAGPRHGAPLRAADALRLQRTVGNAALARMVAAQRAPVTRAAPLQVQRDDRPGPYTVVPGMEAEDKNRRWYDPSDRTAKPVWTPEGGYVKNPSATKLSALVQPNGKIGGGFENGVFTYVVDGNGDVIIARRLGEPGGAPGRATGMPHPTLIGGKNPTVLAAGEVEMRAGRIYRIDNQSGHFQPSRKAMAASVKGFMKMPGSAFHPEFKAESVHYDTAGVRTTKAFRSLQMLKLKARDLKSVLKALKPRAIAGKMRGKAFRTGAKRVAGALATALVWLALQYLLGKLMEKVYEKFIDKQIEELAPKVEEELAKHQDELERLLEEDSEADIYVNVRFTIGAAKTTYYDPETADQGPVDLDLPPVVWLHSVGYSRQPWDPTPIEKREHSCGASDVKTTVTASEVINPKDLFTDEPAGTPQGTGQPAGQ
jgi:hypothetical protein